MDRMKNLVALLCSEACAGRAPGTPGGEKAREIVTSALREGGLDPYAQPIEGCNGANVLATLPGDVDRWVIVAAHYDHLGTLGGDTFHGADDNAAAVSILVEVARALAARRPAGRGVLLAAFDAEEPPYSFTDAMGSEHYARHPAVALEKTDMMICMDLVGHHLGTEQAPDDVRNSLFALGCERSSGTAQLVDEMSEEEGLTLRRIDAEVIPPLSDYDAFWKRKVPFTFLTNGRWQHYHTPQDTPEKLAYGKMAATARWLERYVRACCERDDAVKFRQQPDDVATLRSIISLCESLAAVNNEAEMGRAMAAQLLGACDANGQLPAGRRGEAQMLVAMIESRLSGMG